MSFERLIISNDHAFLQVHKEKLKLEKSIEAATLQLKIIKDCRTIDELYDIVQYDDDVMPLEIKEATTALKKSIDRYKEQLQKMQDRVVVLEEDEEVYNSGGDILAERFKKATR